MLQARVRDRLSPVRGNVLARIRACRLSDGFESRSIRANPFPPSTLFQLSLDRKITRKKSYLENNARRESSIFDKSDEE